MKIINWNISWANDIIPKINYLKEQISGDESFIVILQEVKQYAVQCRKRIFL